MTVTCSQPSRRYACAISTPIAPPPSTSSRRGRALTAVASRLSHGCASASPGIGGSAGRVPVASTTARRRDDAVACPPPSVTTTVRAPSSRPVPRTSAIPCSRSQGSWPVVVPAAGHVVALGQGRRHVDRAGDRLARAGHPSRRGEHVAGADQRLARDAAPVGALAADQLALDEGDGQATVGTATGQHLTRRAGPITMTS